MMKKFLFALSTLLMAAGLIQSAQAGSLDAYRPKKPESSLSCRMDELSSCDSTVKQPSPNKHTVKNREKAAKQPLKHTKTTYAKYRASN